MTEYLRDRSLNLVISGDSPTLIEDIRTGTLTQLMPGEEPVRFAVVESSKGQWRCDVGIHLGRPLPTSIFKFENRRRKRSTNFNVVMLVPTGIGAVVGGHAGDASPVATLLSSVCDTLITHPNVLNASDIIQIPSNALYVEGSLISQLMMGTIGLGYVRSNRLLVLIQAHEDDMFTNAAINSVNAARASYGLNASVILVDPRFRMFSEYTPQGVAVGTVEGLEYVYDVLDARRGQFDAVAVTSIIELPPELHENYYRFGGEVVNPWGGVEAMLTHAISMRYGLPTAHAPMMESRAICEIDFGVVDPRMAAEVISLAFLQCVLRGLQRSPAVVPIGTQTDGQDLHSGDISCLVIPDGCIGLPTLAALITGIPVVAVHGNSNLMRNELDSLPWQEGQFFRVENYLEATGVVAALRAGLDPSSTLRPLEPILVEHAFGVEDSEYNYVSVATPGEVHGNNA